MQHAYGVDIYGRSVCGPTHGDPAAFVDAADPHGRIEVLHARSGRSAPSCVVTVKPGQDAAADMFVESYYQREADRVRAMLGKAEARARRATGGTDA